MKEKCGWYYQNLFSSKMWMISMQEIPKKLSGDKHFDYFRYKSGSDAQNHGGINFINFINFKIEF